MKKRTDLEIVPEVEKLRKFLRGAKVREGKLKVNDLPNFVDSLKRLIPIYQDLKDREHYKNSVRYFKFKMDFILEVLKEGHDIQLNIEGEE